MKNKINRAISTAKGLNNRVEILTALKNDDDDDGGIESTMKERLNRLFLGSLNIMDMDEHGLGRSRSVISSNIVTGDGAILSGFCEVV